LTLSQSIVPLFSDVDDGLEVIDKEQEDSDAASNTRSYSGSLSTAQPSSVKLVGEASEGGTVGASSPSSSDTSEPSHTNKEPSPVKLVGEASEGGTVGEPTFTKHHKRDVDLSGACGIFIIIIIIF